MIIPRPFCIILVSAFLVTVFSCKKTEDTIQDNSTGPGNRITMVTLSGGDMTFQIKKFHYSGNFLDSVTFQNNMDHTFFVWRNNYLDGLIKEMTIYELVSQQFKPFWHAVVLQYSNGIPTTIQVDRYNGQDTVVMRLIYTYTYNSQGLVSQLNKYFLNGSTQTLYEQFDITYEGNNRKRVYKQNNPPGNIGDMRDDYTWSGNQLLQNTKSLYPVSSWVNHTRYTYEYADDRISNYLYFEWRENAWQQIYSEANIYNADGNISEQINTGYSNGLVAKTTYIYTQGSPLYRSFMLVSSPDWPIESPVLPTPP